MSGFTIKDSGERKEFAGGMMRDTAEGKTDFLGIRIGPMFRRWADHTTKGRKKYPDPQPGVPNWTLAEGVEEYLRAKQSAARHFESWLNGELDEDHAAGVFFNINLAEYVRELDPRIDPALGATAKSDRPEPEPEFLYDGDGCDNAGPNGWYCERPLGHDGDHAFDYARYDAPESEGSWPQ